MFEKFCQIWDKHGFEILLGLSVLFLIIMFLFRRGKGGTWNTSLIMTTPSKSSKKPPQESKGEIECRRVLEDIFNRPFPKIRPNFLRNPVTSDGDNFNNLELDCYNDELKLAVEYNGIQHYRYTPYFHKSKDAFQNQKYRDHIKRELCKKNNIFLIEVPNTVKVPDIRTFLISKLSSAGYIKNGRK